MMQLQLQLKKVLDSGMCCFTLQKLFHLHLIAPGKSQLQLQFSEQNKGKTSKEAAPAQSSFQSPLNVIAAQMIPPFLFRDETLVD